MTQEDVRKSIDVFKDGVATYKKAYNGINRTEEELLWTPLTQALEALAAEVNDLRDR